MNDQKTTAISQQLTFGQMVTAKVIQVTPRSETDSDMQRVRTVATSMTTGNVSIRYVPRQTPLSGNMDTTT